MKTIRTVLLTVILLGAIMPAMAQVNFTEKTYCISSEYEPDDVWAKYYNFEDANGLTLTASTNAQKNIGNLTIDNVTAKLWWSSDAVTSSAGNYDESYVQISSKNEGIKRIRLLIRTGNTSKYSQIMLIGWKKDTPIGNVADYSSYTKIEKEPPLQWYTFDLSEWDDIRTIRIYSAVSGNIYVGENNIKRSMGSGYARPYIFGIQVGLSSNTTSISPYGFAAFSSTSALDFTNVTDCNAYYADSYAGGTLHLTKATGVVPADFGLLLCATKGKTTPVCIPVATAACSLTSSNNAFEATSTATYTAASATDAFALGVKNGAAGFYYVGAGVTIPQNRMYLPASKVAGAKSVTLDFGGIDPTGIVNVSDDAATALSSQRPATDLLGRPCPNPAPGQMYIKDGKVRVK